MRAIDFVFQTLAHFARREAGPPPGIPARVDPDFERELIRICEWHSLAPIILDSFQKLALEPVLSEFSLERLKTLSTASEANNGRILDAVDALATGFRCEGVPFLLIDDVAASLSLYPSSRLRPIDEIDLLVREGDWRGILSACGSAGFARNPRDPDFGSATEALSYYQHFSPCVLKNAGRVTVKLRFRLRDLGPPDRSETAWGRGCAVDGDIGDRKRVSLEDLLIRSCVHLTMSRFEGFRAAVDAGLILVRHGRQLDWEYVRSKAESVYPAVYFGCRAVADWLKTSGVPEDFPRPGKARTKLFDLMWRPGRLGMLAKKPPQLHRLRFSLAENGSPSEKVALLTTLLSPKPDWVTAFFGRPCKPWLRLLYSFLALKNGLGVPLAHRRGFRYR